MIDFSMTWDDLNSNPLDDIRRAKALIEADTALPRPESLIIHTALIARLADDPDLARDIGDLIEERFGIRPPSFRDLDGNAVVIPPRQ